MVVRLVFYRKCLLTSCLPPAESTWGRTSNRRKRAGESERAGNERIQGDKTGSER